MLVRDFFANLFRSLLGVRLRALGSLDRCADCTHQRVGDLERIAPGDVEAVEQPVADQVEVCGDGFTGFAVQSAQLLEDFRGIAVRLEQLLRGFVLADRGDQLLDLVGVA